MDITQGGLNWVSSIDIAQFNASIEEMQRRLGLIEDGVKKGGNEIDDFARKVSGAIAGYLSLTAASNLIKDIVKVRGEFQQLEVAFTTMLQSKQKADQLMAQVTQLAATTPFDLQGVATAAKQLLAYGESADTVTKTINMLGNIAAGVGAPLGDIVYTYGTLRTQGRAYAQDIQQFTGKGIPIIDQLAKQFGVTKDKVMDLVGAGKVGFPEVDKALRALTTSGGIFYNLMDAQSKTLTGQISNLGDAWDKMLNDIGKEHEGLAHDILAAATSIVENYQTVLDIIKVLVITYGSYKAAIVATSAVTLVATEIEKGYTIAEILRYQAMLLTERAQKALNASMLASPAAWIAIAIAGLYLSYQKMKDTLMEVKTAQELVNDAQKDVSKDLADQEAEITKYVAVLGNQNIAESVRLEAYNKLKEIAPDIVQGLTFQEAKTKDLTSATAAYIATLRQRIKMEGLQTAYAKALAQQEEARQQLMQTVDDNKQLTGYAKATEGATKLEKAQDNLNKALQARKDIEADLALENGTGTDDAVKNRIRQLQEEQKYVDQNSVAYKEYEDEINKLQASLDAKIKPIETVQNKAYWDAQLKAAKEALAGIKSSDATTSADAIKYRQQIAEAEKNIAMYDTSGKLQKQAEQRENKINELLETRKSILQTIADLQRDATQSGLVKEQSEIDKINEKYDAAIRNVETYNAKVSAYNTKNGTSVAGISDSDVTRLNNARQAEVTNTLLKQDSAAYIANIESKKQAFDDFQAIQQQGNADATQNARNAYKSQIGDYTSYLKYLEAERDKILSAQATAGNNVGLQSTLNAINKAIYDTSQAQDDNEVKNRIAAYNDMIEAARNYNTEKASLDAKYKRLNEALVRAQTTMTQDEYNKRKSALNQQQTNDEASLKSSYTRQSQLYRDLSKDIIDMTRDEIDQQIALMEKYLNDGQVTDKKTGEVRILTPADIQAVQQYIEQLKGIKADTADLFGIPVKQIQKIAGYVSDVGSGFESIGSALADSNAELSQMLIKLGQIANTVADIAQSAAGFASGDVSAGISGASSAIVGLINIFTDKGKAQAQSTVNSFYQSILTGETEVNLLYRERARQQLDINDAKLAELETDKKILELQQQQNQSEYEDLLKQLQDQQYVAGYTYEKKGGVFGIGAQTTAVAQLASLAGMTYDQIEALYTKGQLTDAAKALFEELQKLKDEGQDISDQLTQIQDQTNQIFTGTTADSITNSIVEGFQNGYNSAADFADNFKDLMQKAMLSTFEAQYLAGPLQDFYDQFAALSSSDGLLTSGEIDQLQNMYNQIITNADAQFQNLQSIAGLSAVSSSSSSSSLAGAIQGMTEAQADLLAGQFGGMRTTAIQQLNIANATLTSINLIVNNTSYIPDMQKVLRDFQLNGIKIKA